MATQPKDIIKLCRRGHEQTPENVRYSSKGYGTCRACSKITQQRSAEQFKKPANFNHIVRKIR